LRRCGPLRCLRIVHGHLRPGIFLNQLLRTPECGIVVLELGLGLRDRRLLDVDGGLEGRLFEGVEQVTLLHVRAVHEELLLQEGGDARYDVDAVDRLDPAVKIVALGHRPAFQRDHSEGAGCAIAHGATKMMTGKRTTRSNKETYMARWPSDSAPSRTFNAMPSSSIRGVRDTALFLAHA
jgi:hypothetical protein